MIATYKSIAYAFPTSANAVTLGMGATGAYYVEQTVGNYSVICHNCEGFSAPNDPDLIALFHEYEGEPAPWFLEYGDTRALDALGLRRAS